MVTPMRSRWWARGVIWCTLLYLATASAEPFYTVERVLTLDQAPSGVVFELLQGSPQALKWAIPQIRDDIERLRSRFPQLDIAVVSHGKEEFGLSRKAAKELPGIHQAVQDLSSAQNVPVHVCGTHAGWRGLTAEDFPAYIDVAESGPAQISAYVELGYLKILVRRRD